MAQAIDEKLRIILENYHLCDKHINPIFGMLNEFVARCEILGMMQQMWGLTMAQGNVIIYLSHTLMGILTAQLTPLIICRA